MSNESDISLTRNNMQELTLDDMKMLETEYNYKFNKPSSNNIAVVIQQKGDKNIYEIKDVKFYDNMIDYLSKCKANNILDYEKRKIQIDKTGKFFSKSINEAGEAAIGEVANGEVANGGRRRRKTRAFGKAKKQKKSKRVKY